MHDADLQRVIDRAEDLLDRIDEKAPEQLRQDIFELLQHVDTLHREGLSRLKGILRTAGHGELLTKAADDFAVGVLLDLYDLRPRPEPPRGPRKDERRGFVALDSIGIGLPERDEPGGPGDESARFLVAGVGNVLRGDDGFGIAALEELRRRRLPPDAELIEVGIGGIHLVQRLMGGAFEGLIILDAVDREGAPGTLYELETEVPDPRGSAAGRLTEVDLHQTDPSRVLLMARAVDALPPRVRIIGCQPADTQLSEALTPAVGEAVAKAADRAAALLEEWSREYTATSIAR